MELPRLFLTIGLMLPMLGCAPKRRVPEIIIPVICLSAPVILTDCDDKNPPNCKKSITTFKQGCEIVRAQKEVHKK